MAATSSGRRGMTDIGPLTDFPEGRIQMVRVGGEDVGVLRRHNGVRVIRNRCPHQWGPVCLGRLGPMLEAENPENPEIDATQLVVRCPWHGWEFDVETGRNRYDSRYRVKVWTAKIEKERVLVDLQESRSGSRNDRAPDLLGG